MPSITISHQKHGRRPPRMKLSPPQSIRFFKESERPASQHLRGTEGKVEQRLNPWKLMEDTYIDIYIYL